MEGGLQGKTQALAEEQVEGDLPGKTQALAAEVVGEVGLRWALAGEGGLRGKFQALEAEVVGFGRRIHPSAEGLDQSWVMEVVRVEAPVGGLYVHIHLA